MVRVGYALAALVFVAGAARGAEPDPTSVAGYGRRDPACRAWTDGCTICQADPGGSARCSTTGIACTPRATACEASPPSPEGGTSAPR